MISSHWVLETNTDSPAKKTLTVLDGTQILYHTTYTTPTTQDPIYEDWKNEFGNDAVQYTWFKNGELIADSRIS